MGGATTIEFMAILLNKCLGNGTVSKKWQNAQVILLYKKEDKLNHNNYRPISLLPHPYQLLTKILTNQLTTKFDENQCRFSHGIQYRTAPTIDTNAEYNVSCHLTFVDFNNAFDSVELWTILQGLNNARVQQTPGTQVQKHKYIGKLPFQSRFEMTQLPRKYQ